MSDEMTKVRIPKTTTDVDDGYCPKCGMMDDWFTRQYINPEMFPMLSNEDEFIKGTCVAGGFTWAGSVLCPEVIPDADYVNPYPVPVCWEDFFDSFDDDDFMDAALAMSQIMLNRMTGDARG